MHSGSSSGRITTITKPSGTLRRQNLRDRAYDSLMVDFESRCAYCLQHAKRVGIFEIDHFNPTKKNDPIQEYANLFPSIRHCNNRKLAFWPRSQAERNTGKRLLNPRKEQDYNVQLLEIRATGELIGTTPAARFHIWKLDLNAPFLCKERRDSTELRALTTVVGRMSGLEPDVAQINNNVGTSAGFMISPIRYATSSEIEAYPNMR